MNIFNALSKYILPPLSSAPKNYSHSFYPTTLQALCLLATTTSFKNKITNKPIDKELPQPQQKHVATHLCQEHASAFANSY
jgi:hypothetical protein